MSLSESWVRSGGGFLPALSALGSRQAVTLAACLAVPSPQVTSATLQYLHLLGHSQLLLAALMCILSLRLYLPPCFAENGVIFLLLVALVCSPRVEENCCLVSACSYLRAPVTDPCLFIIPVIHSVPGSETGVFSTILDNYKILSL